MKKITLLFLAFAFWSFNLNAQTYLSEGFESGVPPTGWLDEAGTSDSDGNLWVSTSSRFKTGANSAWFDDFDAAVINDKWLISSAIDLSTAIAPEFLYYDNVEFAAFAGSHVVKYSTDYIGSGDPTAATWTDLNTTIGTEDVWVQNGPYTLPISATVYIAFQYVGDFAAEWFIDDIIVREPLTCTPPTATTGVIDDCGNSQFSIDVMVTNMGDSGTYILSNNYDANTVSVTGTGTWTAGPFPIGNAVTLTLEHDSDSACDTLFGPITDDCPAINDDACNAIALTMNTESSGGFYDNTGMSIEANEAGGSCWFGADPASESLWFTFVAPASGEVRVSTKLGGGTLTDTQLTLYSTTDCSDQTMFTELACDEDDDADILGAGGLQAIIDITTLTGGNTYYVQVDGYAADVGTFDLGVFDLSTLSNDTFEQNLVAISYFPNPVKNKLTIKAQQNIQNVTVLNMLGQEVLRTEMNVQRGELDMSSLQAGAYFVKVSVNNTIETLKIIKK